MAGCPSRNIGSPWTFKISSSTCTSSVPCEDTCKLATNMQKVLAWATEGLACWFQGDSNCCLRLDHDICASVNFEPDWQAIQGKLQPTSSLLRSQSLCLCCASENIVFLFYMHCSYWVLWHLIVSLYRALVAYCFSSLASLVTVRWFPLLCSGHWHCAETWSCGGISCHHPPVSFIAIWFPFVELIVGMNDINLHLHFWLLPAAF